MQCSRLCKVGISTIERCSYFAYNFFPVRYAQIWLHIRSVHDESFLMVYILYAISTVRILNIRLSVIFLCLLFAKLSSGPNVLLQVLVWILSWSVKSLNSLLAFPSDISTVAFELIYVLFLFDWLGTFSLLITVFFRVYNFPLPIPLLSSLVIV